MSSTTLDTRCQPDLVNELDVAAFLSCYPDFFECHPEILIELPIFHLKSGQSVFFGAPVLGLWRTTCHLVGATGFPERIPVDG